MTAQPSPSPSPSPLRGVLSFAVSAWLLYAGVSGLRHVEGVRAGGEAVTLRAYTLHDPGRNLDFDGFAVVGGPRDGEERHERRSDLTLLHEAGEVVPGYFVPGRDRIESARMLEARTERAHGSLAFGALAFALGLFMRVRRRIADALSARYS